MIVLQRKTHDHWVFCLFFVVVRTEGMVTNYIFKGKHVISFNNIQRKFQEIHHFLVKYFTCITNVM